MNEPGRGTWHAGMDRLYHCIEQEERRGAGADLAAHDVPEEGIEAPMLSRRPLFVRSSLQKNLLYIS